MKSLRGLPFFLLCVCAMGLSPAGLRGQETSAAAPAKGVDEPVDMERIRAIRAKVDAGETPTPEERAFAQRAMQAMKQKQNRKKAAAPVSTVPVSDAAIVAALVPLDELKGSYKGEEGGLYGGGLNTPPPAHLAAYLDESRKIQPLDADGKPSAGGKIVLLSIGMSNTTMEYSVFKKVADADPEKSPNVVVVDGAKGARTGLAWSLDGLDVLPAGERERIMDAFAHVGMNITKGFGDTWTGVEQKLSASGVTAQQVQAIWIKQAEASPGKLGEFPAHAKVLQGSLVSILNVARVRYPNLRVAYLSSRIFGGYATTQLNPEPFAYEEAFSARWVIQDQIKGEPRLNYDPARGEVKSPVVMWGPYLWANGMTPRKSDGLIWKLEDFVTSDRTHPDNPAREKVANLLLRFLKTDAGASRWFVKPAASAGR